MAGLLVILTSLFIGAYLFNKYFDVSDNKNIARSLYSAIGLCSAGVIYRLFNLPYDEFIYLISCMTSISLLLVSLLMFVRKLKSGLFHHPFAVVFIPLILPVSYLLIYDVVMLREIMFVCVGVISLLVPTLLIESYKKEERTGTFSIAIMGAISMAILNRSLSVFPVQLPNLELIIIGIGGVALLYLFLKAFEKEIINHKTPID